MPVKFSKSSKKYEKGSRKWTWEHDYIKNRTKEDLIKEINEGNKPKLKQKCRIELDRRGVKLVWVTPEQETD